MMLHCECCENSFDEDELVDHGDHGRICIYCVEEIEKEEALDEMYREMEREHLGYDGEEL